MTPSRNVVEWLNRPQARVAVIGAGGWIGAALVHAILCACPDMDQDRLRLFGSRARVIEISGRALTVEALDQAAGPAAGDWLVLHAGVIGADRLPDPDDLRRANDALLQSVLRLCERLPAAALVAVSSGAVHRLDTDGPAKRAYARMKRDHEQRVLAWAQAAGARLAIPRVFNIGGPYINHASAYALGDFIQQAERDGRIAIGSAAPVFRSYVHGLELAQVVLDAAMDAAAPPTLTFDAAGDRVVEMIDLARAVGAALGRPDLPISRPAPTGGDADWYVGDGRDYQTRLFAMGVRPASLERIISDTVAYLRRVSPPA